MLDQQKSRTREFQLVIRPRSDNAGNTYGLKGVRQFLEDHSLGPGAELAAFQKAGGQLVIGCHTQAEPNPAVRSAVESISSLAGPQIQTAAAGQRGPKAKTVCAVFPGSGRYV